VKITLRSKKPGTRALSLIEITLVIGVMLTLVSIVTFSVGSIMDWRKGRDAAEKLRAVYLAQKSFLADQPSKSFATFTDAELIPYLPGRPGAIPVQLGMDGEALVINVQQLPPVFSNGVDRYDPSGSSSDGLWDVGSL